MKDSLRKSITRIQKKLNEATMQEIIGASSLILFLSSLVGIRSINYFYLAIALLYGVNKLLKGNSLKDKSFVILLAITVGIHVTYRSNSTGLLNIILGVITGVLLISTYNAFSYGKK